MNLSILVHTFSKYSHLWPGFISSWKAHCPYDVIFGTDIPCENDSLLRDNGIRILYSGAGEWSDRLKSLLEQIKSPYIFYLQEDHWPTRSHPEIGHLMQIITRKDLSRLQISPIVHFYKLTNEDHTIYFQPESKYLVSHQPSIWKKSFLLDSLKPGETPWVNEYKGTLRWQQSSATREYITKKIAIYPCDWFSHKCIKGKVVGMQ